jgi:hypothetical protein
MVLRKVPFWTIGAIDGHFMFVKKIDPVFGIHANPKHKIRAHIRVMGFWKLSLGFFRGEVASEKRTRLTTLDFEFRRPVDAWLTGF